MDSFQGLTPKVPHHGINLWLKIQIFYDHVNPITRRTIDQAAGGKLRDKNDKESWALLEDITLYDNESRNDPRDFAKPVKAISMPHDVPSASDRRLIELENQVQRMMEAHLSQSKPVQVNKIDSSSKVCSGPHDTQYYMEDPERAFVEYASTRTDEAGNKWYTFNPEENNLGDTYNPSWNNHLNLSRGCEFVWLAVEQPGEGVRVGFKNSRGAVWFSAVRVAFGLSQQLGSPELDLFSDIKEHSEEETTEIMTETMEQYMSKTCGNHGSGVVRPKINDKTHFELKGQYLKELRENTFSGSKHEDANKHIEKFLEIVDLFHISEVTQDQVMLRVFPMSLTGAASRWLRNEPSSSITN
ncbi:hypothetical protein Tco_0974765 [Tanacetum coccineum]|uniref:Reverse transcriptase domain-containing protein n=1 Tax=Tanacetum coccineum TaxID=301880 RepID=A0ABQ5ECR9_9ASTR